MGGYTPRAAMPTVPRRTLACLAGLLAAWPGASTARAAGCDPTQTQPFLRWRDPARYVLAAGGALEAGSTRWRFTHGARLVPGNEPFFVHAASDRSSLSLPSGSVA